MCCIIGQAHVPGAIGTSQSGMVHVQNIKDTTEHTEKAEVGTPFAVKGHSSSWEEQTIWEVTETPTRNHWTDRNESLEQSLAFVCLTKQVIVHDEVRSCEPVEDGPAEPDEN